MGNIPEKFILRFFVEKRRNQAGGFAYVCFFLLYNFIFKLKLAVFSV